MEVIIMMNETLMRANRVAVKANGENFVADFYRTHKAVGSIHSENTDWVAPEDATNKTAARESFRQWAIANCADWGIDWKPQDMRTQSNVRKAKYDSDQALIDDAMSMLIPEMRALVDKCKYDIEWGGVNHEEIEPATHTGTGRELSTLGIVDGKYEKSGNWAWATLKFMTTFKFKGEECYIITAMQLVSGQLKKTGMGITEFNSKVKAEIIDAGLATEAELDPPKEAKPKKSKEETPADEPVVEETVEEVAVAEEEIQTAEEPVVEETPAPKKRQRKSKKSEQTA